MKDIIKRILLDFLDRSFSDLIPRKRAIPLDSGKIVTLIGPRRAGKTYTLFEQIQSLEKSGVDRRRIFYLNFEDERLDFEGRYDIIFEAYLELYPDIGLSEVFLFFDEIQQLPDWERFIRRVYDSTTRRIFLTGSNSNLLSSEIATALRGRSLSFEILPLSFKESLLFKGIDPDKRHSTKNTAKITILFEEYLQWGGNPELIGVEPEIKTLILQEYFNVMIFRDLVERYEIGEISLIKFLIRRLVDCATKEYSVNRIHNDLKSRGFALGKDSLYSLVDQIMSVYLFCNIERYDPSIVKREMGKKKIYLYDHGFLYALRRNFSKEVGRALENLVFIELRRRTKEIYFLQNGWECDFLFFEENHRPKSIQVTARLDRENVKREIKGLIQSNIRIPGTEVLLLYHEMEVGLSVPENIKLQSITEWLLE